MDQENELVPLETLETPMRMLAQDDQVPYDTCLFPSPDHEQHFRAHFPGEYMRAWAENDFIETVLVATPYVEQAREFFSSLQLSTPNPIESSIFTREMGQIDFTPIDDMQGFHIVMHRQHVTAQEVLTLRNWGFESGLFSALEKAKSPIWPTTDNLRMLYLMQEFAPSKGPQILQASSLPSGLLGPR